MTSAGPIEILTKEIGAAYDPATESPATLLAFLAELLRRYAKERDFLFALRLPGKEDPRMAKRGPILAGLRTLVQCTSLSADALIDEAEKTACAIDAIDSDDGWPRDPYLNFLKGVTCAIRFGLEQPCHSRWPAEAGASLVKRIYQFRLEDRFTRDLIHAWLRDCLTEALANVGRTSSPHCTSCGGDDVIAYADAATAICPTCCERSDHDGFGVGHEFEHHHSSGGRRETLCKFCSVEPSEDWYSEELDRG